MFAIDRVVFLVMSEHESTGQEVIPRNSLALATWTGNSLPEFLPALNGGFLPVDGRPFRDLPVPAFILCLTFDVEGHWAGKSIRYGQAFSHRLEAKGTWICYPPTLPAAPVP